MKDLILPEQWGRELMERPAVQAKTPELPQPPAGTVRCACAKKIIPYEEVKFHDTPHVSGISDTICTECLNNVKNFALIVCLGCKAVVARVPPSVQPNGFRFEANGKYHIYRCPNCVKESLASSTVIEADIYAQENGLATKMFSFGKK